MLDHNAPEKENNRTKVGILGGSFNPPHAGHLYLAEQAHKLLKLDEVWLLPVPLSTLKHTKDVAPFPERLSLCERLAATHPWLHTKPYEADIATNETIDTVTYLHKTFPHHNFTWLMGADSFAGIHTWGRSSTFINHIKTAVFSRTETENTAAQNSITAQNMQQHTPETFLNTGNSPQSGWCFFNIPPHAGRATHIRRSLASGEKPAHIPDDMWQEIQGSRFYAAP